MPNYIADDAKAISEGLKRLEQERKQILNNGEEEIELVITNTGCIDGTLGHFNPSMYQFWTDEQVQDGNSPPLDELEQFVGPYGENRWRRKPTSSNGFSIPIYANI